MNNLLFIFMLFGMQLIYWCVGRLTSKNVVGKDDYFLAGKSVRLFPLMMTFLATQVGGGIVLGAADEAYRFGWFVILYPLGAALGLILLGSGIGRKLAGFKVSTVAQILEIVYGSTWLRKSASILSVISLFMILVAQIIASNKFLISLGFYHPPLFIAFWAIVILYTAQGGLKAVISTDMLQAAFFAVVFFLTFGIALYYGGSSFTIPAVESFSVASSKWCGWLLMPLLFMVIEQDMGQRCFAGASPKIVSRASLIAGICTLAICVIPVFFGTIARTLELDMPEGGSVLMATVAKTTNPWVTALVGCAVIAAIISTATSLINAISSNLMHDFTFPFFQRLTTLRMAQGMTAALSIAALFFAFYFDNIVNLLIQSYELSVSCLFVPIFLALFRKRGNPLAAWLAIIFGAFGFVFFRMYPIAFPKEVFSILLSFTGYACGTLFTREVAARKA